MGDITYDCTELADERRLPRARATTADTLRASLDRLGALAEREAPYAPRPVSAAAGRVPADHGGAHDRLT